MLVSVVVPTMRVGGIDVLFDSLANQSFTDFEIVIVDALYYRRRDLVLEEARNRFLAVRHVGLSGPGLFPVCSYAAMMNAGIVASTGEILLLLTDFSVLPPDLVRTHAEFHLADASGKQGLMMPHRYVGLDVDLSFPVYAREDIDKYVADIESGALDRFMFSIGKPNGRPALPHKVDGGNIAQPDADPKLRMAPGPIEPSFFHCKNESFRREHAIAVNGFDQDFDGSHGWQDSEFGERLTVKAGVKWTLKSGPVVEIANPRGVFPAPVHTRPFGDNEKIWQRNKAAGYPTPNRFNLAELKVNTAAAARRDDVRQPSDGPDQSKTGRAEDGAGPSGGQLRLGFIYGEFSSAIHGPFDLEGLYTRVGLTGSESSFFNLARTLAERGHNVVAFCVCEKPYEHPSGLVILPIQLLPRLKEIELDAAIAWNEPDYLQFAPPGVLRVVDQQLNDWGYCKPGWQDLADLFVFPSASSRNHHIKDEGLAKALLHGDVIPNSVDLDLFAGPAPQRNPHRVVYCSSPDRGLHHLLSWWPEIRRRVPDAELRIFYRLEPWLARARENDDPVGRRARYIEEALIRLTAGNFGVTVPGPVPNAQMARELQAAAVLAYPCDPVRYTEGFGCSVLDAAAGGCIPIISDADALEEVHGNASVVIKGKPQDMRSAWIEVIEYFLKNVPDDNHKIKMSSHASAHSRHVIAEQWEQLLR